jgi:hypothetical protein
VLQYKKSEFPSNFAFAEVCKFSDLNLVNNEFSSHIFGKILY